VVLVDTSVWVSHLRAGNARLADLLNEGEVTCHHLVIGELACGHIRNRAEVLTLLRALPMAAEADHEEVLALIERHRLMGRGLGYVDMHLLASALLSDVSLWTLDNRLRQVAGDLGVAV